MTADATVAVASTVVDIAAVALSLLCLLHCLALPLLVALLPLASAAVVADERFHRWMLWLVVPTAVIALASGWRQHRRPAIVGLGAFGAALIAFAAYGGQLVGLSETGDTVSTVIGASLLALAHLWNLTAQGRLQGRLHWHRPGSRHDHVH